MKTLSIKAKDIKKKWFLIDANKKTLGRLSTQIASRLKGKHSPLYTPHTNMGDYIIVINARKIFLTGKKPENKVYNHHTGYIGGLKSIPFKRLIKENPTRVIHEAVKGMLPKNSLGRQIFRKLKVYAEENHPHEAQKPEKIEL